MTRARRGPTGRRHPERPGASRQRGFTLIELMIVVAVVAILATIGYPSYREYVLRSNRAIGQALLAEAAARQERLYSDTNSFTADMTALGFAADPVVSDGGLYQVDGAACTDGTLASCFTLTATAIGNQTEDTRCATMSLDSLGRRSAAASGGAASAECWK